MKIYKLKKVLSLLSAAIMMMGVIHSPLVVAAHGSTAKHFGQKKDSR